MANFYVRSAATGSADGSSWANAFTSIAAALVGRTNADVLWVANDHDFNTTGAIVWSCPSSPGLRILCVNTNSTEPPTGLATTAVERIGSASVSFVITGFVYIYGIIMRSATNNSASSNMFFNNNANPSGIVIERCLIDLRASGSSGGFLHLGPASGTTNDDIYAEIINTNIKFATTSGIILVRPGRYIIRGLGFDAASATPTTLFLPVNSCNASLLMESSDLSGKSITNLVNVSINSTTDFLFRYVKLPASIAITTGTNPSLGGAVVRMHNCDSSDTNYRIAEHFSTGRTVIETTIIRSGGANDGTTTLAWKMTTLSSASYPQTLLKSPEMVIWNDTSGSSKTVNVEIIHDSQGAGTGGRFQNDEIWLEVQYLGDASYPQGTTITNAKADVMASSADQADSSETWTTTGLTTPVKQNLSVTFTPQEKGYFLARVCMAKASKVCYVDPKLIVT